LVIRVPASQAGRAALWSALASTWSRLGRFTVQSFGQVEDLDALSYQRHEDPFFLSAAHETQQSKQWHRPESRDQGAGYQISVDQPAKLKAIQPRHDSADDYPELVIECPLSYFS